MRSFFERVDVDTVLRGVAVPASSTERFSLAAAGAALGPGQDAPLRYVRAAIDFEPYFGSRYGAAGTLLAGSGNSLDRALLLSELYRLRGQEARVVSGRLDWASAARLVGGSPPASYSPGDPWVRWVEMTSDHYWVQVRRRGSWVDIDPSYDMTTEEGGGPTSRPARQATGSAGAAERMEPGGAARLTATVMAENRTLARIETSVAAAVRGGVRLSFVPGSEGVLEAAQAARASRAASRRTADDETLDDLDLSQEQLVEALPEYADSVALTLTVGDEVVEIPRSARESSQGSAVPPAPSGASSTDTPSRSQAVAGDPDQDSTDRILASPGNAGAEPALIELRVEVRNVNGGSTALTLTLPPGTRSSAVVVLGVGDSYRPVLADRLAGLYESLNRLAVVEGRILEDYSSRDRDGLTEGAGPAAASDSMTTGSQTTSGVAGPHPGLGLHLAALRAAGDFDRSGPEVLALLALAALRELRQVVGLARRGTALAGVAWRPPQSETLRRAQVWLVDDVVVDRDSGMASAVHAGYGLVRLAVLSQILNRLASEVSVTAFDTTLRAAVNGRTRWREWGADDGSADGSSFVGWPVTARSAAQGQLDAGATIVGPAVMPTGGAERPAFIPAVEGERGEGEVASRLGSGAESRQAAHAWWAIPAGGGTPSGWVYADGTPSQGQVALFEARDDRRLASVLSGVRGLHQAFRSLLSMGATEGSPLSGLRQGACAAATLVAVQGGSLGSSFQPDITPFCGN